MIDDSTKEEIIKDILQYIHQGGSLAEGIKQQQEKHNSKFEDPTTGVVKRFWKGVRKEVSKKMKGSDKDVQDKALKAATSAVRNFLTGIKFKGKFIRTRILDTLPQITEDSKHRLSITDKFNKDMDNFEKEMEAILPLLERAGKRNLYPVLERIFNEISIQIFNAPDSEELEKLNMMVEDFYKELGEVDLKKANDRERMYMFWERVQDKYPELVTAVNNLKDVLEDQRPDDKEYQDLVAELEVPPPYIKKIGIVEKQFSTHVERIIDLISRLGAKRPARTTYSRQTVRTKDGKLQPELSQRVPEKAPGGTRDERVFEGEVEGTVPTFATTLKLDPILWHNISQELQELPVGMGEDLEDILEELGVIREALPEGDQKRLIEDLIEELKESVKDIPEAIMFLPITYWLREFDSGVIEEINEITTKTGKFFAVLNRLFLESGKLPITMSPKVGGPQRGAAGGAIQVSGKDDPQGFRRPRTQGTPSEIPSEKLEEYISEVKEEFDKLKELLNAYYFQPLSKGKFVDEKPEFVDKGGVDFGEEFDPDATTQEGRYPYRAMELNFGTSAKAKTLQNMLRALDDNFFDTELLEDLINYLQLLKGGFSSVEGWENYVREIQLGITNILDELMPDFAEEHRIWGAGKIGEAILAHQDKKLLSELKYFNKPLDEYYQKYLEMGDKDLPLTNLRSILQSPDFQNLLREEQENSSKEDFDALDKSIDKIMDLTEPKKEKGVKEQIDIQESRIGKSLLTVHDYINKMNGLPIYYGKLDIEDVDDVDYLINKIEKEDKLEINCVEITGIVNSIDSHSNISKSFGVTEKIVYKIKGLCR